MLRYGNRRAAPAPEPDADAPGGSPPAPRRGWATPEAGADRRAEPKRVTGNQEADDDIAAFYRAKEELAQMQAKG